MDLELARLFELIRAASLAAREYGASHGGSRELSLTMTKLDEARLWLEAAVADREAATTSAALVARIAGLDAD